jgi:hypothetical protein
MEETNLYNKIKELEHESKTIGVKETIPNG